MACFCIYLRLSPLAVTGPIGPVHNLSLRTSRGSLREWVKWWQSFEKNAPPLIQHDLINFAYSHHGKWSCRHVSKNTTLVTRRTPVCCLPIVRSVVIPHSALLIDAASCWLLPGRVCVCVFTWLGLALCPEMRLYIHHYSIVSGCGQLRDQLCTSPPLPLQPVDRFRTPQVH